MVGEEAGGSRGCGETHKTGMKLELSFFFSLHIAEVGRLRSLEELSDATDRQSSKSDQTNPNPTRIIDRNCPLCSWSGRVVSQVGWMDGQRLDPCWCLCNLVIFWVWNVWTVSLMENFEQFLLLM